MRINLRATDANLVHTKFVVFVNGKNCGMLTMSGNKAVTFHHIVHMGCKRGLDDFKSEGHWLPKIKEARDE